MESDKCGPTNLSAIHESKFSVKHLFFNFHYLTHSVSTFCLPRNLLFVYPSLHEYPFCLLSYKIILLLYYQCIVLKTLLVYLLKTTFYLHPRITSCLFYGWLRQPPSPYKGSLRSQLDSWLLTKLHCGAVTRRMEESLMLHVGNNMHSTTCHQQATV